MKNNHLYPCPKMILFDWDNTLMDTTPVLFKAFCAMRKYYNLPEYSMEEYQARTGLSLRETFPDLFGQRWEEAKQVYLQAYQENHLSLLTPFDKAYELITYAYEKIGKLGVVSNKTNFILQEEIDHLGWGGFFYADADMLCAKASGCFPVRMANENKDGKDVLTVKNCQELLSVLYSLG